MLSDTADKGVTALENARLPAMGAMGGPRGSNGVVPGIRNWAVCMAAGWIQVDVCFERLDYALGRPGHLRLRGSSAADSRTGTLVRVGRLRLPVHTLAASKVSASEVSMPGQCPGTAGGDRTGA